MPDNELMDIVRSGQVFHTITR